ncbi:hypothetical protein ABE057_20930 [Bacillus paralicheniformis]|uniref:hypothetical protein n=1 Tax=Bacillus TaxID=1386 RepID=UPI001FBA1F7F|nr:hypothetical protein [Bacillus sp. B19-2]MCJ2145010.1 hypothetical protein [Bacillus sp. B19-2]
MELRLGFPGSHALLMNKIFPFSLIVGRGCHFRFCYSGVNSLFVIGETLNNCYLKANDLHFLVVWLSGGLMPAVAKGSILYPTIKRGG